MTVANDIKSLRECTGLNQTKFAAALNIPLRTVQDWERGVRSCPPYVVELIAFRIANDASLKPTN